MESMTILEDLIDRHEISMRISKVLENPILTDEIPQGELDHYLCRLSKPGKEIGVYLSTDADDEHPTLSEVLIMLALDGSGCRMMRDYEPKVTEWGPFLTGVTSETGELEMFWQEYKGRCKQSEELRRFLGDNSYDELLGHFGVD